MSATPASTLPSATAPTTTPTSTRTRRSPRTTPARTSSRSAPSRPPTAARPRTSPTASAYDQDGQGRRHRQHLGHAVHPGRRTATSPASAWRSTRRSVAWSTPASAWRTAASTRAIGNISDNAGSDGVSPRPGRRDPLQQLAELGQRLRRRSGHRDQPAAWPPTPPTATARIRTGGAQGQGNVSSTFFDQQADSTIDGFGAVHQHAGRRRGQRRRRHRQQRLQRRHRQRLDQRQRPRPGRGDRDRQRGQQRAGRLRPGHREQLRRGLERLRRHGPHHHRRGARPPATRRPRTSPSTRTATSTDMGLIVGTQVGGVANLGVGVANSGFNAALGNVSDNDIDGLGRRGQPRRAGRRDRLRGEPALHRLLRRRGHRGQRRRRHERVRRRGLRLHGRCGGQRQRVVHDADPGPEPDGRVRG